MKVEFWCRIAEGRLPVGLDRESFLTAIASAYIERATERFPEANIYFDIDIIHYQSGGCFTSVQVIDDDGEEIISDDVESFFCWVTRAVENALQDNKFYN